MRQEEGGLKITKSTILKNQRIYTGKKQPPKKPAFLLKKKSDHAGVGLWIYNIFLIKSI
jgi:hypothetical protein